MTKMAAMPICGKNISKFFFSGTTGPISTKLGTRVLQCVYKLWPLDDLDLFYGKVNIGRPCIWMEKIVKMSFERQILQEMGKWTEGR